MHEPPHGHLHVLLTVDGKSSTRRSQSGSDQGFSKNSEDGARMHNHPTLLHVLFSPFEALLSLGDKVWEHVVNEFLLVGGHGAIVIDNVYTARAQRDRQGEEPH